MQRSDAGTPRGIVHAATGPGYHKRYLPVAALAPIIAHFWVAGWDVRGQPPRRVETLPHPPEHIVFETGRAAEIGGVHHGRFSGKLCGLGRVFGIKFRPGELARDRFMSPCFAGSGHARCRRQPPDYMEPSCKQRCTKQQKTTQA